VNLGCLMKSVFLWLLFKSDIDICIVIKESAKVMIY